MDPEIKTEGVVDTTNNEGDAKIQNDGTDNVTVPKKDYDTMNQTLGSLKRQLKDYQKSSKEEVKETPKSKQTDVNPLLERLEKVSLRQAGINHPDDIELARTTAKKWGMEIEDVVLDDDFKVKLERLQSGRSNAEATSNIKGSASGSQAKNTPEYWIAKGKPPTPIDVPDRKTRVKIARAMMASSTNGKKFYND